MLSLQNLRGGWSLASCVRVHSGRSLASNIHSGRSLANNDQSGRSKEQIRKNSRRVVVTGLGLVTCLGVGVQHVWHRVIQGDCGLSKLTDPAYENIPCRVAGLVPRGEQPGELDLDTYIVKSQQRSMSLATCYALVAAEEAIKQSQWLPHTEEQRCRTGVAVGMGMVPLTEIVDTGRTLADVGYNRVSPHFVPKILVNMAAGHISLKYGFKGVNHAVSTACTTGAHALGDATRFIQHGDVDVMVCGGSEASVSPLGLAGFSRMRALSTNYNDRPHEASRPFDKDRDGFVMSDGAGIVVLEELEHAITRGATIYGEILGYGLSADAHHVTAPSDTGDGAYRCMQAAIANSGLTQQDIGYFNAHATSTPIGDLAECRAISRLVGERRVPVSSTKGAVGHLLGAAGCIETVFTLLACHTATIPPTLNCTHTDTDFNLDFIPHKHRQWDSDSRIAVSNSFGFGGTNASLCVSNYS